MKQLLLLLLLLPVAALSQTIQSDQTNDSGTIRRIATTRIEFNGFTTSLGGTLKLTPYEKVLSLNLFFKALSATAINEKSKAILQLENNEVLYLNNTGAYRALLTGNAGSIHFTLTDAEKLKLQTLKVIKYSIETNNGVVAVELNKSYQKAFMKTISLLESQALGQNSLGQGL